MTTSTRGYGLRRKWVRILPVSQALTALFLGLLFVVLLLLAGSVSLYPRTSFATYFENLKQDPDSLRALLKQVPKGGELHSHLSGAVPFEHLLAVAAKHDYRVAFTRSGQYVCGIARPSSVPNWKEPCSSTDFYLKRASELTADERDKLREAITLGLDDTDRNEKADFAEFGRIFGRLEALTDSADVMPDLLKAVMQRASENGVSYVELRLNPIGRTDSLGDQVPVEDLIAGLEAAAEEKNHQLGGRRAVLVKFVIGLNRRNPESLGGGTTIQAISCNPQCPARLKQAYYLAARRYGRVVVGLDLVGLPEIEVVLRDPLSVTIDTLKNEFGPATFTLHAGETKRLEWKHHIMQAIQAGAGRIGHGFNLEHDSEASLLVCQREIPLEISLTSNMRLGLLENDDLRTHPFPRYFRAEICPRDGRPEGGHLPVTLSTDDAGIFETDLTQEFYLATTTFDLTWDEVKLLCRNSLVHAFASESERLALLRRWEDEVAQLESSVSWFERPLSRVQDVVDAVSGFFFRLFSGSATLGVLFLLGTYVILYWLYLFAFKKHFITVAPFRVWGKLRRIVPGKGLAARFSDELMRLQQEMQHSPPSEYAEEEPSFYPSEVELPGPAQVTVEYEGISPEALNSFLRRLFRRQVLITGDVIPNGAGLLFVLRTARFGPWEVCTRTTETSEIRMALQEVAIRVISSQHPRAAPDVGNALVTRQRRAIDEGNYDEALRQARLALMIDSDHSIDHYNLGIALAKKGQHDDAIAAFKKAIALRRGEYPEAFNSLANRLVAKGESDEAILAYQEAIRLRNGEYPEALYNLAGAFMERGQLDQAASAYEDALSYKPDFAQANYNLGIVQARRGDLVSAIAAFGKAVALRPNNADYHFNLGLALKKSGHADRSQSEFAKAHSLDHRLKPPE